MLEIRGIWLCHKSRWDPYVLRPRIWVETPRSGTVPHIGPYSYPAGVTDGPVGGASRQFLLRHRLGRPPLLPPFMTLVSPLRALGRHPCPVFRLLRGFTGMARIPILHDTLALLRGEVEHRSSKMEAVVLFSEEERRIYHA